MKRASQLAAIACIALFTASCSRALPFNFTFAASSDGGTSANDLATPPADLSMSSPDLAIDDLGALDGGAKDLGKDLTVPDLVASPDLRTRPDFSLGVQHLGAACNPNDFIPCGVLTDLECLTFFGDPSEGNTTPIENGYCTRACTQDDDCAPINGRCRLLGGSGYVCMPACDNNGCARENYSCCQHCPSGPSCIAGSVCAPPNAPDYNTCSS